VDIVTPNPSPLIASQTVISPKANIAYTFDEHATAFLNSGFGFHSNDARAAVMASTANVIPRAFGSELGFRWADETVAISAAAWLLDLESEFIWVGDEGTTEQAGRSRRLGIDIEARLHPASWLTLGGSATVSRGRLQDLPDGENFISLAPTFTLTSFALVELYAVTTSIRLRHIGARPANESYSVEASGYTIIDLQGTLPLSETLAMTVQCENLLNADWREAQFDTASRLQNEVETTSEIHYTPGTPLNVRVGLTLAF
jgi:outer membrane receptor protein involved in Fe transport